MNSAFFKSMVAHHARLSDSAKDKSEKRPSKITPLKAAGKASVIPAVRHYRTIWISDIHLGTKSCKAKYLLDFFRYHESDRLYLLGDFVDGWRLKRFWYWVQEHNDVIQKILRKARKGTQVIYIPGNHDAAFREFTGIRFGNISIEREVIHDMQDGGKFLVTHGDQCDRLIRFDKVLAFLGNFFYGIISRVNDILDRLRRWAKLPYWSLSGHIKTRIKNAVDYVNRFETALANEAKNRGLDGVICGHIHHADKREIDGITYVNDGDWVENCTALAEKMDGTLELIQWAKVTSVVAKPDAKKRVS